MKNYGDKEIKRASENHGAGMPDFGIGHVTPNAMRKDWAHESYSMSQDGNGSMNYLSEKDMTCKKDASRLEKHKAKVGYAV